MKPKDVDIEDHADRIDTICTYIDLLPGNHHMLTDMEKKSLLFNTFPKTWRSEFTLNRNDPELASEKEIKDFMEKKKELADKEESHKEKSKAKLKKLEDIKKKRDDKRGNQPCRTHGGAHLWKDCPSNPKNKGRGNRTRNGVFNRTLTKGFNNRHQEYGFNRNNMGRGHPGRSFGGRSFSGRSYGGRGPGGRGSFQGQSFGRERGTPQEQLFQHNHMRSDDSMLSTTQSSSFSDWDDHSNDNFYTHYQNSGHGHYPF